ncbi:MAG: sulfur carrier protein ThiS [Pseudodesulfovibrio sp.]
MVVVINGKETEIVDGLSVLGLLESRQLTPETVVIELNKDIVSSDVFGSTLLNDGDHLEVLRFVGGG